MLEEHVDESVCSFGAKVLLERLDALTKEIEGVRKAEDSESIHQMRVASRRLRSALAIFRECFPVKTVDRWIKRARKLTRVLGSARDLDVQIEFINNLINGLTEEKLKPGLRRLSVRLQQQRSKIQPEIVMMVDKIENEGFSEDIRRACHHIITNAQIHNEEHFSSLIYEKAYREISFRLQEFLSFENYVTHPEQPDKLHAMRIACKRLRYTMEIFSKLYPDEVKVYIEDLKKIQTLLGDFNDCVVWVNFLDAFLEEEKVRTLEYFGTTKPFGRIRQGVVYVRQDRERHLKQCYEKFLSFWTEKKEQNTWNSVLQIIRSGISINKEVI